MSIHVWSLGRKTYSLLWMLPHVFPLSNHSFVAFQNITTKTSLNPRVFSEHLKPAKPFEVHSLETPPKKLMLIHFRHLLILPQSFTPFIPSCIQVWWIFSYTIQSLSVDFFGFSWYVNLPFAPLDPTGSALGFPSQLQWMEPKDLCTSGPRERWIHMLDGDRWKTLVHWTTLKSIESLRVLWLYVLFVYLYLNIYHIYTYAW